MTVDVLVTGAAGFIGSHLVDRLLAEGKRVVGLDDLSTGRIANLSEARQYGPAFTFYNLDIRSDGLGTLFERHRPALVMHLAAQSGVRPSLLDPRHDASVNVMGLLNVLESSTRAGVGKVVLRLQRRHDLRRAAQVPRQGVRGELGAAAVALRRHQEAGARLPPLLPPLPQARLHRARPGQRLRPPPGPQRRGRRHRDLHREDADERTARRSSATGTRPGTTSSSTTPSTRSRSPAARGARASC